MSGKVFGKILSIWLSGFFTVLIIVSFLALSAAAYAEEIIYTGDGKVLQKLPSWFSDEKYYFGLFPGTTAAPLSIGNKVTIDYAPNVSGATNPAFVLGGLSESEKTEGNSVTLLNGQVDEYLIGGTSYYSGGSVGGLVCGGWSRRGSVTGNTVTINGGFLARAAYGGISYKGDVTDNTVTISGGSVKGNVFGGWRCNAQFHVRSAFC